MPISDFSTTPASNTTINGISVAEGWAPSSVNDAIRQLMADVRYEQAINASLTASASVAIGAASGVIPIQGTATITSLGTVSAGTVRKLVFTGACVLTHNASSLILPGGANITTAAGDTAEFVSLGSGNWRCMSYTRATGYALIEREPLLSSQTASSSSALNFTSVLSSSYTRYRMELNSLAPATNGANLLIQASTNNGSSWLSTNENYYMIAKNDIANATIFDGTGENAAVAMALAISLYNSGVAFGDVDFLVSGTSLQATWRIFYQDSSNNISQLTGGGLIVGSSINAIRLVMSSGNIASGTARLFGVR